MFEILFANRAEKDYKRMEKIYIGRIDLLLTALKSNPLPYDSYDIKKMQGFENTYRIRVGKIRITYAIDWNINLIKIRDITYRETAYGFH